MTTREKFEQILTECKVSKEHAVTIMDLSVPIVDGKYEDVTWDSPADEYPRYFYIEVFDLVIREVAMDWLAENVWSVGNS